MTEQTGNAATHPREEEVLRTDAAGAVDASALAALLADHAAHLRLHGKRLLVLVPDGTRSGPTATVVDAVRRAFRPVVSRIDVLVALGTHPPLRRQGLAGLLGDETLSQTHVHNHAWHRSDTFVHLGTVTGEQMTRISGGLLTEPTEVRVNKLVTECDHVLVCGPVFPHEVVGFSGGNKYFFPGVSGPEMIGVSHWLGALLTSYRTIGTLGPNPVRTLIDRATAMIPTPRSALCYVTSPSDPATIRSAYAGPSEDAWQLAAERSSRLHVKHLGRSFHTVVSVLPPMYDEMWVGAKGMYKVEPVVSTGGEVVIYAPQVRHLSRVHGTAIREIGYHTRDYFLAQWERFRDHPWAALAHSTHLAGAGSYDLATGVETRRIRVTLATGIAEEECRRVGLGYLDPARITPSTLARPGDESSLLVPRAGETLLRP